MFKQNQLLRYILKKFENNNKPNDELNDELNDKQINDILLK